MLKINISFLYGYIHWINGWTDTFSFFHASKIVAKLWPEHPFMMLRFIFGPQMLPIPDEYQFIFGQSAIPYYGLARSGFIVRVNSFFQIFSGGFYSVHCIFFSFISTIGIFSIHNFFSKFFLNKSILLKYFIYFTPTIIYWTSGAHKDSLILFGIGLILFTLKRFLQQKNSMRFFVLLATCYFIYYARNYVMLLLLPSLFALLITEIFQKKPIPVFISTYTLGVLFFFAGPFIHPSLNFPQKFIDVQTIFISIGGGSAIAMPQLEPNLISFIKATPSALANIILRPGIQSIQSNLQLLAVIENFCLISLGILSVLLISFKKKSYKQHQLILFALSFAIGYYLLLGFTVSNLGAIVRYRSVPLMFLGIGLICLIDNEKLPKKIQNYLNQQSIKIKTNGRR